MKHEQVFYLTAVFAELPFFSRCIYCTPRNRVRNVSHDPSVKVSDDSSAEVCARVLIVNMHKIL